MKAVEKVKLAAEKDPKILCERGQEDTTFGSNPQYLLDIHGITKSDLIRLERKGLAVKARYVTQAGPHRVRWIIFTEVNNVL